MNSTEVSVEKIEIMARKKFGYYKKSYIDGQLFRHDEVFRDSVIDELVKEYEDLKPIVDKTKPRFNFLKEALIIRHFSLFGFEKYKFGRKSDIEKLIEYTNNLYDISLESENNKYLDKIMSLFPKSEIKRVEERINSINI
ncbi:hypothetical protein [Paenibacillus odorifer]|uniref:hypothetical protein n=1 Tax=Paenibacillus odorifer TaxID=189426 RepID=UPI00096F5D8E|nr:hypothetical protein [Paenibacillus odorifer]OMD75288.1 hypothetical protein BSK50_18995 [Paenibacillus odorifer]